MLHIDWSYTNGSSEPKSFHDPAIPILCVYGAASEKRTPASLIVSANGTRACCGEMNHSIYGPARLPKPVPAYNIQAAPTLYKIYPTFYFHGSLFSGKTSDQTVSSDFEAASVKGLLVSEARQLSKPQPLAETTTLPSSLPFSAG